MISINELEKMGFSMNSSESGIKQLENGLQIIIRLLKGINELENKWEIEIMYDNEINREKQFHKAIFKEFNNINILKKLLIEFANIKMEKLIASNIKQIEDIIELAVLRATKNNNQNEA